MSILDYLFYSVVGITVVFCALVLLMIIIKILMSVTTQKANTAKATQIASKDAKGVSSSPSTLASPALAPGSAGEVALYDTDPRDAAMIMAIVADTLGKPLNELRFISIREVKK